MLNVQILGFIQICLRSFVSFSHHANSKFKSEVFLTNRTQFHRAIYTSTQTPDPSLYRTKICVVECIMEMQERSRILIIGATGHLGKHLVEASVKLSHATFALVRKATEDSNPEKAELMKSFKNSGVIILYGDLNDHKSLVNAIKQADVVFSVMAPHPGQLVDQIHIISAIKEVGTIKRYIPSDFGADVDQVRMLEPAKSIVEIKSQIRQAIKEAGIPFTFVSSNFFPTYFLSRLGQVEATDLPEDRVFILGDGNSKVIFVDEHDIAMYSIKASDDPRALNKNLYIKPPANICSANEFVTLWEKKVGKTLERVYIHEEEILRRIRECPAPLPFYYATAHAAFVKGEQTNFEVDPLAGVEASQLYPDVMYTSVDELLDELKNCGFPLKR